MKAAHAQAAAVGALLLALLAPCSQGTFTDPLPDLTAAVTAAAWGPGMRVAGHDNGQVVGVDDATGFDRWSANVGAAVRDLAVRGDQVLALAGAQATAFWLGNGTVAWTLREDAVLVAADAEGDQWWLARSDGVLAQLDGAGRVAARHATGLASVTDLDVVGGRWAAAGAAGLAVAGTGGGAPLALGGQFQRVRWTGSGAGLAVDGAGRLQRFTAATGLAVQPAALSSTVSALDAAPGAAAAGGPEGFVHALDGDGTPRFAPIATYANSILDVALAGDHAVVATRGGWLGSIALEPAPIALLLAPADGAIVPNPFTVRWAYADPDAAPGDQVRHRISVRSPGGAWQVVATGFSPADPLSRLREQAVDLAAFASGSALDLRLEVIDKDGRSRTTAVSRPLLLDSEPPYAAGGISPADGERVAVARPLVGVGHRDRDSGVLGSATVIVLDGESGHVDWKSQPSFTEFQPVYDLADGWHSWQVTVQDRAGNRFTRGGTFLVDTTLPTPGTPEVEALLDVVVLRFTTPEPAACEARASTHRVQDGLGTGHALALSGLAPDTAYDVLLTCQDEAGTSATRSVPVRTLPGAAGAGIRLDVRTDPEAPGSLGYFTTPPAIVATADPPEATLSWSVDGQPLAPMPAHAAVGDGRHNVLVLARAADGAGTTRALQVAVDASPPDVPAPAVDEARRSLSWTPVTDPQSGVVQLRLEGLLDGSWLTLLDLPAIARQADGLPPDVTQVRLVARNGAGLEASRNATLPAAAAGDLLLSTASVLASQVGADERVHVRVRLAPPDASAEVVLVDANGVHRPFSDHVGVGPRVQDHSAPASAFPAGRHAVLVRLLPSGTTLDVGSVDIAAAAHQSATGTRGEAVAQRDSPAIGPWLALGLAAMAWGQRRRR